MRNGRRSRGVNLYAPAGTTSGASLASVSFTPITVRIAPAMDSAAKKYLKGARSGYKELATKHRGTPWEVLGKREELTALGMEWQAY